MFIRTRSYLSSKLADCINPGGWVKVCQTFFAKKNFSFPSRNNAAVKAILHSRDINVAVQRELLLPQLRDPIPLSALWTAAIPQLLPVTSGGKQWRDVGHENGSAFVAGNCLSFCYFAASKSQTSADDFWRRVNVFSQPLLRLSTFNFGDTFGSFLSRINKKTIFFIPRQKF